MSLAPTYTGYIGSTKDAVLVIQGVLSKQFLVLHRRPHDRERPELIKSGSVFVFIEEQSGIRRWTDGIAWSPSRILGRFLVYRELNPLAHHDREEKKKRKRMSDAGRRQTQPADFPSRFSSLSSDLSDLDLSHFSNDRFSAPLYDDPAYHFSPNLPVVSKPPPHMFKKSAAEDHSLIKKTLSVTTTLKDVNLTNVEEKQTIHLILYYSAYDVLLGKLLRPTQTNLRYLPVLPELREAVQKLTLGGKIPIEDEAYYFLDLNYQLQNMSVLVLEEKRRWEGAKNDSPLQPRQPALGSVVLSVAPGVSVQASVGAPALGGTAHEVAAYAMHEGAPAAANAAHAASHAGGVGRTAAHSHQMSCSPVYYQQPHNAPAPPQLAHNSNPAFSVASLQTHSLQGFLQPDLGASVYSPPYPHSLPYPMYNTNAALLNPANTQSDPSMSAFHSHQDIHSINPPIQDSFHLFHSQPHFQPFHPQPFHQPLFEPLSHPLQPLQKEKQPE